MAFSFGEEKLGLRLPSFPSYDDTVEVDYYGVTFEYTYKEDATSGIYLFVGANPKVSIYKDEDRSVSNGSADDWNHFLTLSCNGVAICIEENVLTKVSFSYVVKS